MLRRLAFTLLTAIVLSGVGIAGLFYWSDRTFKEPGPLAKETTLVISAGSGLAQIAKDLEAAGIIRTAPVFVAQLRLSGDHTRLKAGEYRFPAAVSQADVARMLIDNDVVSRRVTVPEGLTSREIIAILQATEGLSGEISRIPPEGTLLPETYAFQLGEDRNAVLNRMERAMADALTDLWQDRASNLPFTTVEEAVVLASIVEKETGVGAERAKVAGVFVNRLRKGMRLQSDPTVIFALTEGQQPLGRALTRQDWKVEHPYNTYRNAGLPPGPITNPGPDALKAAMQPGTTTALYFVADGSGGHAFADTLQEHNRNVAAWRKIRDAK